MNKKLYKNILKIILFHVMIFIRKEFFNKYVLKINFFQVVKIGIYG